VTSATYIEEAHEKYREKNVKNGQKKKDIPNRTSLAYE
jgi:hypothetical protein